MIENIPHPVLEQSLSLKNEENMAMQSARLEHYFKLMNAKAWSHNMEQLLKMWGEKAFCMRWMHLRAAQYWKGLDSRLSITGIVFSSVASLTSMTSADSNSFPKYQSLIMYTVGALGMMGVLFQSIKRFYSGEEKSSDHIAAAKQYGTFHRTIALQLGMNRESRKPHDQLGNWALTEFERIQRDAPTIQESVLHAFRKEFEGSNIAVPDIVNPNFNIEIHAE